MQTPIQDNQGTEDVIEATVTCDFCRKSEPLEKFNGQASFRVPAGWIQVKPQVLRHRDDKDGLLKLMKVSEINERVSKLVPTLHLCTDCIVDREVLEQRQREKDQKEREKLAAKQKAEEEKVNRAVVEVTRVTSGRRLITEGVESGHSV